MHLRIGVLRGSVGILDDYRLNLGGLFLAYHPLPDSIARSATKENYLVPLSIILVLVLAHILNDSNIL